MKRGFALVLVSASLTLTLTVPAGAADAGRVEDQISDAYARVFDQTLSLRDRLSEVERGQDLRSTLKKFDALDKVAGIEVRDISLKVHSVRALGGDAEVRLEVYAASSMITGWSGVAHKIEGRWVVARDTLCTLFLEYTRVRCPDGPKRVDYSKRKPAKTRTIDGETVIPITFTDGDRADLVVPADLPHDWQIVPHAELVLEERTPLFVYFQDGRVRAQQAVRDYPGAPGRDSVTLDAMFGLLVHLDGWTAYIAADSLSERDRHLIAKHLDGYTTKSGFPVLIPTGPLHFRETDLPVAGGVVLAKSALNVDTARNPMELWYSDGDEVFMTVVITPGPCPAVLQRPFVSGEYAAEERCTAYGFGRIAVEGNADFVTRLLDELHVENYRVAPALSNA